jgi:hypothetical protein
MDVGIPPFQETSIYSIKEGFALPGLTTREQSKKNARFLVLGSSRP